MKKFYITTAIDYANDAPHIGHALEKIQADVFTRYQRQKGKKTFFLTGVDEHGIKIERAAALVGKSPKEFVSQNSDKFKELKKILNLSWDDFIRTSDKKRHWPGVIKIWQSLDKAGDFYKKKYKGLYCVGCEAFKTEKELIDGKCSDHQKAPEVIEEENYFFRLSKYSKIIESKIKNDEIKIVPQSRKNEILSFFKRGLIDISVSRPRKSLSWGIPVPGDSSQVMYVWLEALVNYLSAIGYGRNSEFKKFWPADIHFIGKDILRFHAVIWSAMLISAKLPLPKKIFVHGFITVNGQKMSKTIGNIIDPVDLAKRYGADALRYYLLREIPAYDDGDFTEEKFRVRYNGDLANGLGNFTARVLTLASRDVNLRICANKNIDKKVKEIKKSVEQKLEEFKFHEALAAIWQLISFGDNYINKTEPWKIANLDKKSRVLMDLIMILKNSAELLEPFLPQTSEKILKSVKISQKIIKIKKGENLFPRI